MSRLGYPRPKSSAVTAVMRANRKTNSGPERRIRARIHADGLRYRVYLPIELGGKRVKPDIVFTRARVAVFVDGCFWHACPEHGTRPRHNTQYWIPKLKRNVLRDERIDALLAEAGWQVVRIWEHTNIDEAVQSIGSVVRLRLQRVAGLRTLGSIGSKSRSRKFHESALR